jgi:hypothetical protein
LPNKRSTFYTHRAARIANRKFWHVVATVYLRWAGLAACILGLAAYYAARSTTGSDD